MKTEKIRQFSEAFRREKVKEIEKKQITVGQLSRIYAVSRQAIYYWINQYSSMKTKRERVVIEKESEGYKTMQLLKKVSELERIIGQKEVELAYLDRVIKIGSELIGEDLKKKYDTQF